MGKLSPYELLSRVWNECTFDEILEFGLSNDYIGSESIINAASTYSDPNKEFSDEELKEIIKDADLDLILDVLDEKYTIGEVIGRYDNDDILNCFDVDTLIDFCEYDLQDKYDEERNAGYEEGYKDACKDCETNEFHPIKDGTVDDKWRYLCNEFDLTYYDNIGLYNKILELIKLLNKSTYKDRNDKPWGELK